MTSTNTYYLANAERIKAYQREYRKSHPVSPEKRKQYRLRHKKKKGHEYDHERYMRDREKILAKRKEKYPEIKERLMTYHKAYYAKNKELIKLREYERERDK